MDKITCKPDVISFIAVVTHFVEQSYKGRKFYKICLKKQSGKDETAYAWADEYQGMQFSFPVEVAVTGVYRYYKGQKRFQVYSLCEDLDSVVLNHGLTVRPKQYFSLTQQQKEGVLKLNYLVDAINSPVLKDFLIQVFAQESILYPFIQLPASINHHHNMAGGLLIHSIECAEFVFHAALNSKLPVQERELATIAALLHDIGKIKTLEASGKKHSLVGHHIPHEQLTLLLLSPFLKKLEKKWPHGAALLMQFLVWDRKQKFFPANPASLLIKVADQLSTGMNIREQSFKGKPEHFYFSRYHGNSGAYFVNRLLPDTPLLE